MCEVQRPTFHTYRHYPESLQDLNDFMSRMDFIDVELRGNPYTWTNNRKGKDLIQVRLDRLLVTGNWNRLGNSHLENLTRTTSDHSPLIF